MPSRPAHYCPGCRTTHTSGCPKHEAFRTGRKAGQGTTARGYGHQWRKVRARVMARDCALCQPCKRNGRLTEAQAVDHIVPKSHGGTDDMSNLQAICNACHAGKTAAEGNASR